MTPAARALFAQLRSRGVSLVADGDRLRCRPAAALTAALLAALTAHKTELLAHLQAEQLRLTFRVDTFRAQLAAGEPTSLLAGHAAPLGTCQLCGERWPDDRYGLRCDLCAEAMWLAMGRTPPVPTAKLRCLDFQPGTYEQHMAPEGESHGDASVVPPTPWIWGTAS